MPAKTRAKCPEVPRLLVEWLEKFVPEPKFSDDPHRMAFDAGRRDIVKTLRLHHESQTKAK